MIQLYPNGGNTEWKIKDVCQKGENIEQKVKDICTVDIKLGFVVEKSDKGFYEK